MSPVRSPAASAPRNPGTGLGPPSPRHRPTGPGGHEFTAVLPEALRHGQERCVCRRGCSPHPGLAQPRPRQLCAESSAEAGGARPPPGARGLVGLPNFWRNGLQTGRGEVGKRLGRGCGATMTPTHSFPELGVAPQTPGCQRSRGSTTSSQKFRAQCWTSWGSPSMVPEGAA